jgi:hypothetical protein
MFTKKVTDDDNFMALSSSAQALYLHLSMSADDDGFCNQVSISMFKAHASVQDLQALLEKRYIYQFDNGVIVIKHWRMANALRKDRYTPTAFQEELARLDLKDNGAYTLYPSGCQVVAKRLPQDSIGKDSIGKDSIGNKGKKHKVFVPPTFEEVLEYAKEKGREDLAKEFFEYFTVGEWVDSKGNKVKNWKQKFITWCSRNEKKKGATNEVNSGDNGRSDRQKYGNYC